MAIFLGQPLVYGGPVVYAVIKSDLNELKRLLASGESVDDRGSRGDTALMVAISYTPSMEILQELLNRGADISAADKYGRTAIKLASLQNSLFRSDTINMFKNWSLKNQVRVTDAEDIKILDGDKPVSYEREYIAYGNFLQRRATRRKAVT